jgi:hypothetical protein
VGTDFLERHEEAGEVGIAVQRFGFGERRSVAVPAAKFEQGRGLDGSFEMEM